MYTQFQTRLLPVVVGLYLYVKKIPVEIPHWKSFRKKKALRFTVKKSSTIRTADTADA